MFQIIDDSLIDSVGMDSLPPAGKKEIENARKALQSDCRPAKYRCRQEGDSWQIQIPYGDLRMLLGYDIFEKRALIFTNYLKWDETGPAIEETRSLRKWLLGLLDHKP